MTSSIKRKVTVSLLAASVLLVGAVSAKALTLDEQRKFDKWNAYFASDEGHSAEVTKKCGITLPVKLDPAFVTPFMTENKNAASFCDTALAGVADTCGDDAGKAAVAAKVKSLSCVYSPTKDAASFALANGELQFTFGDDASNIEDKAKKFLGSNL